MLGEDWSYPRLLLVGLIVSLSMTVFVAAGTSSASLGAYNPAWDGTSEIRAGAESAGAETTIARNVSMYDRATPTRTVAIILSPTDPYDETDVSAVRTFVRTGGTLLVAEDYGQYSNDLLAAIGASARVDGTPLRDEQRAGPGPAFPRSTPTTNHTYTSGVDGLMLNHGSVVNPGDATPLMNSSAFSYLDTNRNQALDDSEVLRPRPVVTVESVGSGTVLVVSDPSVFLNSMLEHSDNAAFLQAIVGTHDHVLLDVSRSASPPPLVTLRLVLQQSGAIAFVTGCLSVLILNVLSGPLGVIDRVSSWRTDVVQPPDLSSAEIAATIRARHPEWDEERIERVTDSLMAHRQKRNIDD